MIGVLPCDRMFSGLMGKMPIDPTGWKPALRLRAEFFNTLLGSTFSVNLVAVPREFLKALRNRVVAQFEKALSC